jgi:hypothetical protein
MVDAASSAALGALLVGAAPSLGAVLGLPTGLPFAVFVALVARRATISRGGVWAVVICNVLWVADSIALLTSAQVQPTVLGTAFVIAQAALVALLAELEFIAVRRSGVLATA